MTSGAAALCERVLTGHVPSIARLITLLERRDPEAVATLSALHRAGGGAHVVGVTGAPGSGKSTLVASLARQLRAAEKTVAVVAVDPSSSLTGGAILGDRIRMGDHTLDPGVFVRSMSTRGRLGGVAQATVDVVTVLDAARWDYVVVETVGVGQAEVEIVAIAHTTVVVSVPGLGDDVQTLKAGLLEVADLHVVNKADRADADRTVAELLGMLALAAPAQDGWPIPVLPTNALTGAGVAELAAAIDDHLERLRSSGRIERRERDAAAARVVAIARDLVLERIHDPAAGVAFEELVDDVVARRLDPHAAARSLIDPAYLERTA